MVRRTVDHAVLAGHLVAALLAIDEVEAEVGIFAVYRHGVERQHLKLVLGIALDRLVDEHIVGLGTGHDHHHRHTTLRAGGPTAAPHHELAVTYAAVAVYLQPRLAGRYADAPAGIRRHLHRLTLPRARVFSLQVLALMLPLVFGDIPCGREDEVLLVERQRDVGLGTLADDDAGHLVAVFEDQRGVAVVARGLRRYRHRHEVVAAA